MPSARAFSLCRSVRGELAGSDLAVGARGYRRRMALDDAISKARQEQERQDEQERLKKQWERESQQRVQELGAEAFQRLRPYLGESLHAFRAVRGPRNTRTYQRAGSWWCWRIKDLDAGSISRWRKVLLLVLDSDQTTTAFAVVTLDRPSPKEGQYLTTLTPDLVGPSHYAEQGVLVWVGTDWVKHLEQDVAEAIVRYERER